MGGILGSGGGGAGQMMPMYIPPPPPPPAANPATMASGQVARAGESARGTGPMTGKGAGFGGTDLTSGGSIATGAGSNVAAPKLTTV